MGKSAYDKPEGGNMSYNEEVLLFNFNNANLPHRMW